MISIYDNWRNLSKFIEKMDFRAVNLPEGLSEPAFALAKGFWRCRGNISGGGSSFDCYDPYGDRGNNRIQVKACSVIPDLSSFGPKSEWDRIFFVDFYRDGNWDKTFDIYEIFTHDLNNFKVKSNQTFSEQKMQGRRPRLSIYKGLILKGKFRTKETFRINSQGVVRE